MKVVYRSGFTMILVLATIATGLNEADAQLITDAETVEACEVLRLGAGINVPEWLAFARTPSLKLDPAGRLHVQPSGGPAVVNVLADNGDLVRTIGGRGEGPGEFTSIGNWGFVGDTLWLQNWPMLHTSFFDSAGALVRTEADHGPPSASPRLWRTSVPLGGGRGLYIPPLGDTDAPRAELPILVGSRAETARDTLAFKYSFTGMLIDGIGTFSYQPIIIPPLYQVPPDGDGVVIADWESDRPDRVILHHFDGNGRAVSETVIEASLYPVSANARRTFVDEGAQRAQGPYNGARRRGEDVPENLRDAVEDGLLLPEHFAPIRSFFLTHGGRIWLQDAVGPEGYPVGPEGYGAQWVVIDPAGAAVFRVLAPSEVTFRAAHENRVWGTGVTDLDVPYIVLYELAEPGRCRA